MDIEPIKYFKNLNPFIIKAKYLYGVPNLNDSFLIRFIPLKDGIEFQEASNPKRNFVLKKENILKISVEDQSSIESRIGFGRLLLVGIFALAWKKRQNIPLSFLIFEYKNEFNDLQEMYIQSDSKTGFQDFTNIKYNLNKVWLLADKNPDFINLLEFAEKENIQIREKEKGDFAMGCLGILVIILLIYLAFFYK